MSKRKQKKRTAKPVQRIPAPPRPATPKRRRPTWLPWVVIPAVTALAAWGYLSLRGTHPNDPSLNWVVPNPDSTAMSPLVARAFQEARQALLESRNTPEAWGTLGAVCDAHAEYACAEVCYERARVLAPGDFQWVYNLAIVKDFRGAEVQDIRSLFQEAIKLKPDYVATHIRYGEALVRNGMFPEARDAYRKAAEIDPGLAVAHHGLGLAALSLGKPEAGVKHLERAIELEPDVGISYSTIARAYMMLGDSKKADEASEKSKQLTGKRNLPDSIRLAVETLAVDPQSIADRAQTNMRNGKYAKAVSDFLLFNQMSPNNPIAQMHLGTCYKETGRPELAREYFEKAVALREDLVPAYIGLGDVLTMQGLFVKATVHYRKALGYEPGNVRAHVSLGLSLGRQEDFTGAIQSYERAVTLSPSDPRILVDLGNLLLLRGDPAQAVVRLKESLRLNPNIPAAHYSLGKALEQLGRPEEAITHYKRAVRLNPNHPAGRRLAELGISPADG